MTLPLTRSQVLRGFAWINASFGPSLSQAVSGTPVTLPLVAAIACKETFNIWLPRIDAVPAGRLLGCCIGDASGDVAGHPRRAFPQTTAAFRQRYGDARTDMLVGETNAARALRGLPPAHMVYKGYGIFQYDLQHVLADQDFFFGRQWHDMGACAAKLVGELQAKLQASGGDLRGAVRRYNGAGPAAEEYADTVMQFKAWCEGGA